MVNSYNAKLYSSYVHPQVESQEYKITQWKKQKNTYSIITYILNTKMCKSEVYNYM